MSSSHYEWLLVKEETLAGEHRLRSGEVDFVIVVSSLTGVRLLSEGHLSLSSMQLRLGYEPCRTCYRRRGETKAQEN